MLRAVLWEDMLVEYKDAVLQAYGVVYRCTCRSITSRWNEQTGLLVVGF